MRYAALLAVIFLAVVSFAARKLLIESQNIVGYAGNQLKQGLNEITLTMDSLDIFPTMDKVVRFQPPEGVIGDDLVFDLDGKRRNYRFVAYDGTNYVLTTGAKFQLSPIGLDWIPLRVRFWLNHASTNDVSLVNSGLANDMVMEKISPRPPNLKREMTIKQVNDKGEIERILFSR